MNPLVKSETAFFKLTFFCSHCTAQLQWPDKSLKYSLAGGHLVGKFKESSELCLPVNRTRPLLFNTVSTVLTSGLMSPGTSHTGSSVCCPCCCSGASRLEERNREFYIFIKSFLPSSMAVYHQYLSPLVSGEPAMGMRVKTTTTTTNEDIPNRPLSDSKAYLSLWVCRGSSATWGEDLTEVSNNDHNSHHRTIK